MKKYLILFFIIFSVFYSTAVKAENYSVNSPENFSLKQDNERILFILDFSNSMTEPLENKTKLEMMLETMERILPTIPKNTHVGLRVYGHKMGFTQFDACKASTLLVPVMPASCNKIQQKLLKTNPRGMTPITYSLKKAVESDFLGYSGQKHIILLTDGGENCDESPCLWAMELVKTRKDIKIDVIAFNIYNEDDLDQLKCTALVTRGKFHSANTSAELIKSLQNSLNSQKNVEATILPNN